MPFILLWVIFCIVPAMIASGKGRSGMGFFLLSLFLSPLIGLIAALIASPAQKPQTVIVNQSPGVVQPIPHEHIVEDHVAVLERLSGLREKGIISEEEFITEKSKLLN